jgi:hypothetical protein
VWTGGMWLRIGTSGRLLKDTEMNLCVSQKSGHLFITFTQEGLCCMELVIWLG